MNIFKLILTGLLLFIYVGAHAEEVDDFVVPQKRPPDSTASVNEIINNQLGETVQILTREKVKCSDRSKIEQVLKYALNSNFSEIGRKLLKQLKEFQFGGMDSSQSVYKNTGGAWGPIPCCIERLSVTGIHIGIDKIDHFFGNGGMLWAEMQKRQYKTMDSATQQKMALQLNSNQEHGGWGLRGGGPKSYADLAANWKGYGFWKELVDGDQPFIRCENDIFTLNRTFDIKNYIDQDWNESYNCSSFIDKKTASAVDRELAERKMKCPMDRKICDQLKKKYSPEIAHAILSPQCRDAKVKRAQVEKAGSLNWMEMGDMLGGLDMKRIVEVMKKQRGAQ